MNVRQAIPREAIPSVADAAFGLAFDGEGNDAPDRFEGDG